MSHAEAAMVVGSRPRVYGSVCSGIEAATVAWRPLGWRAAWFAEIDPFCRALLKHHYPEVYNHGDFTRIGADAGPIDVLVGGTPCQDFSVAGLRAGMAGARGNLTLEFLALAGRLRPRWLVWENVPGVLSIDGGRAFGAVLRGLGELGYGFAYRVLDAQYFGVPQRRRRVFVVGRLGDWRGAAAVLFESHSLSGHPPPSRETREGVAGCLGGGSAERGWSPDTDRMTFVPSTAGTLKSNSGGGGFGSDPSETFIPELAYALNAHGGTGRIDGESETFVTHSLRADGFDASEDGTGRGTPLIPVAFSAKDYGADAGGLAPTLRAMPHDRSHANAGGQVAVCVQEGQTGVREYDTAGTVRSDAPGSQPGGSLIRERYAVRRLTPREYERLMGLPDDYTLIPYRGKPAADGPRYRAIGNSMAVPVMRWIGERIEAVERIAATPDRRAGEQEAAC